MKIFKISLIIAYICLGLVLLLFITSTYAFVTIKVLDNTNETNVDINTFNKNMKIVYTDTSNLSLVNAYTGEHILKTFKIENNGDAIVYFDVVLEKVINDFANPDDLVYTIKCNENGVFVSETTMPKSDTVILSNIPIEPGEKQHYSMDITFLQTNTDQSNNMQKTFSSNINVIASKNTSSGKKLYSEKNSLGSVILDSYVGVEDSEEFNNLTDGVYKTNNSTNGANTYFYRGSNNLKNNVIFNNYCFKILRTTENNGIRLVYNGEAIDGVCGSSSPVIGKSAFNNYSNFNAYVGFLFGTASSNSYEKEHENANSSTIKERLDTWYISNFAKATDYFDDDAMYCSNRKLTDFVYQGVLYDKLGYANNSSGYYFMKEYTIDNNKLSYYCNNSNDRLTVTNDYGSKVLTYPVGLLTLDELYFSGLLKNGNNFLRIDDNYWTMTPAYYNGANAYNYIVKGNGVNPTNVSDEYGIRPVITLKSNIKYTSGDGSLETPYIVE